MYCNKHQIKGIHNINFKISDTIPDWKLPSFHPLEWFQSAQSSLREKRTQHSTLALLWYRNSKDGFQESYIICYN